MTGAPQRVTVLAAVLLAAESPVPPTRHAGSARGRPAQPVWDTDFFQGIQFPRTFGDSIDLELLGVGR